MASWIFNQPYKFKLMYPITQPAHFLSQVGLDKIHFRDGTFYFLACEIRRDKQGAGGQGSVKEVQSHLVFVYQAPGPYQWGIS